MDHLLTFCGIKYRVNYLREKFSFCLLIILVHFQSNVKYVVIFLEFYIIIFIKLLAKHVEKDITLFLNDYELYTITLSLAK
jgi:hypothetical protein